LRARSRSASGRKRRIRAQVAAARFADPKTYAPVTALRRPRTGHVGDYVTWLRIGLAAFGGLVIVAVH